MLIPGVITGIWLFAVSPALAILTLNLSDNVEINQVQYYWGGDASGANVDGRIINSNPATVLDVSDPNRQAKVGSAPPTNRLIFGSASNFPNSQIIRVRIWDGEAQGENGRYTALRNFSNPALSPATSAFDISWSFIRAVPNTPEIFRLAASIIQEIGADDVSQVTFTSRIPAREDGLAVEIASYTWELEYNGSSIEPPGGNQSLTIATPDFTFSSGDVYRARVRCTNLWGAASEWSDWYAYEVGVGVAPVPVSAITASFRFHRIEDGLGLNPMSFPFASVEGVENVDQLVRAINELAEANVVTTVGWWDTEVMAPAGYAIVYGSDTINDIDRAISIGTAPDDPAGVPLIMDQSFQLSVLIDGVEFQLTGSRR